MEERVDDSTNEKNGVGSTTTHLTQTKTVRKYIITKFKKLIKQMT
jgi:hypothetical protein